MVGKNMSAAFYRSRKNPGKEKITGYSYEPWHIRYVGSVEVAREITEEQYANRMILREAMLRHGFKPLEEEWWHFTLKDEPYS